MHIYVGSYSYMYYAIKYLSEAIQYLQNTTEMYGDGPTTEPKEFRDEAGPPLVVYMVRPTPGKV